MKQRLVKYFSVVNLVMALLVIDVLLSSQQKLEPVDHYFEASQLYDIGEYEEALVHFERVISDSLIHIIRHPQFQLKLANCYYQTGHYDKAVATFRSDLAQLGLVEDHIELLALKSELAIGDTNQIITKLRGFETRFPETPLKSEVDSLIAHLSFDQKQWRQSANYFKRMLKKRRFNKGDIYSKMIRIAEARGHMITLRTYAYKIISKYPFHVESRGAFDAIIDHFTTTGQLIPRDKLKVLFRYLTKTKQFDDVDALLLSQVQLGGETEQIRWLRIRQEYLKQNYWVAFQACNEQRDRFSSRKYLREVDLHIARCYLRLGSVNKAIDAYASWQKTYPKDYLAPEVLWVIAWLCEEQGRIDQARSFYLDLLRTYPRSEFNDEARFRIGLTYYRQGRYDVARFKWTEYRQRQRSRELKARYRYWIAKTYEREENYGEYLKVLDELSQKPFANYYSLKSFLMTTDPEQLQQASDSLLWEINHSKTTFLPEYMDNFRRPLIVQEILGDRYAQFELNHLAKTMKAPNWEMLYAVGEVNERLQNFGNAYRVYRRVYDRKFSQSAWKDWVFLFKRLYPLYFDSEVNTYAERWGLTPASIWAIIKKESAFEPQIMSYANAYGLMQIIPPTANRLTESLGMELEDVRKLYDPNFNILLGSYYLSNLLKRYSGNLYHALAAYNAGEHRVDRWRKVVDTADDDFFMENIEFEQTRVYVRRVMKFYWTYHLMTKPHETPSHLKPFPRELAEKQMEVAPVPQN